MKTLLLTLIVLFALGSCTTTPEISGQPIGWRNRLAWDTQTESNAFGFYVHRFEEPNGEVRILNKGNPLDAAGTTTTPQRYVFYDLDVEAGRTYFYKLEQVDLDGSRHWVIGDPNPIAGTAKLLTDIETQEIETRGAMFRTESR